MFIRSDKTIIRMKIWECLTIIQLWKEMYSESQRRMLFGVKCANQLLDNNRRPCEDTVWNWSKQKPLLYGYELKCLHKQKWNCLAILINCMLGIKKKTLWSLRTLPHLWSTRGIILWSCFEQKEVVHFTNKKMTPWKKKMTWTYWINIWRH